MTLTMRNFENLTLDGMRDFLAGSQSLDVSVAAAQRYGLLERVLEKQRYRRLSRGGKGVVRRFLGKVVGLSRAQLTRLISRWTKCSKIERQTARRPRFPRRYIAADIALLAELDSVHEQLSGPANRALLERAYKVFDDQRFQRLAGISVSHIYNLRASAAYRKIRVQVTRTPSRQAAIGERRKPDPRGRPGYIRVETVHQGHHDNCRGLYHINAVDTVTQWQVVGCVETISERHLAPVLEAILHQFCFRIRGFHRDNGSEFVNHTVAKLLGKLLIEFTKSRPYHSADNALVEGKNRAVIRKQIGYGAIGAEHAEAFQKFYTAHLNPYLNFHRPCGYATETIDERGRRRRRYRSHDYRTPYEKLLSLPGWEREPKKGISAKWLATQAERMSDTEAARRMQQAKTALLAKVRGR